MVGVLVGRLVLRLPVLRLIGVLAGGMTSTPGLAASTGLSPTSFAASSYATVYPAALIAMIVSVKVILAVW
jgi:putative transport protein